VNLKIVHLTSVHQRHDTRIFYKMCISLAKYGFNVFLVVADGKGDENIKKVLIKDVGKTMGGRFSRMTKTASSIFSEAKDLDGDIYHLHDPELIPVGLKLKKLGKKVIFDAHEDLPKQLLGKPYLNKFSSYILSKLFLIYEHLKCNKFDSIVSATPSIRDKFIKINSNTVKIENFPIIDELSKNLPWSKKKNQVCYVGAISQLRGIEEVIKSLEFVENIQLNLIGSFNEKKLKDRVKSYAGWKQVNEFGFLERSMVANVMSQSKAGIVTFLPAPNHVDSRPNKLFEYMSAGIPVIASNFTYWREIVETNKCGICVDPKNPSAISDAIKYLLDNQEKAELMGKNGMEAVKNKYNWNIEEKKLLDLYLSI
jgi:glycosyltransferase involved in cell wall biosynthesis